MLIRKNELGITGTSHAAESPFCWAKAWSDSPLGPEIFANAALGGASAGLPCLYQENGNDKLIDSVEVQTETVIGLCRARNEAPEAIVSMPFGNDSLVQAVKDLVQGPITVHPHHAANRESLIASYGEQGMYERVAEMVTIPSILRAAGRVASELPDTKYIVATDFDMSNAPLVRSYGASESMRLCQFVLGSQLRDAWPHVIDLIGFKPLAEHWEADGIHLNAAGMRELASYIAMQVIKLPSFELPVQQIAA